MNILYISGLDGRPWAGPTYSVPKQIEAQAKIDNVFWYNLFDGSRPEWRETDWKKLPYYHNLAEYPRGTIVDLPTPFSHPDLIIVEQFYQFAKKPIRREITKGSIPYIIIPRGELTRSAQKRHRLKKMLGNAIIFHRFAKKAAAIQYLTEQERSDSGEKWNGSALVIPNGTDLPDVVKTSFSQDELHCILIGRIEPYQKGLDLLLEACTMIRQELLGANCKITICGPDRVGRLAELIKTTEALGLSGIVQFGDAVYGAEKERLLLNSDVFLIPSRFEGHPMALVEALAYGLPCVATTGSNMRREIEDYDAGWTADNSAKGIADALLKMLSERSLFEQKGENAKKLAKHYAWDALACRSHQEYERLLKESHS